MTHLTAWRNALTQHLTEFAPLAKDDPTLHRIFGLTAAAVLWHVRDFPNDDSQKAQLIEACPDPEHKKQLQRCVGGWDNKTPLQAAQDLSKRYRDNRDTLEPVLTSLMGNFITELLEVKMLGRASIHVGGDITGANIVIGGIQVVEGNLIIQYIQPKTERMCPTPPNPPEKFAGRDTRLAEISELIRSGTTTAITAMHGLGGIGKTTLAKALARAMYTDKTFKAVLWADVTRNPNAQQIMSSWVTTYADSAFDVSRYKGDLIAIANATREHLDAVINEKCEHCEQERVLMVLDDVWQNGIETARLLQEACPINTTLLITTRSEGIAIDLGVTTPQVLAYLTPEESVQVLQAYLETIPFEVAKSLGETLGGHALALKLAARRLMKEQRAGETTEDKWKRVLKNYADGIPAGSPFAELKLEDGTDKNEDNLTLSLSLGYDDLKSNPEDKDSAAQARFRALGVLAYDVPFSVGMLSALWKESLESVHDHANQLRLLGLLDLEGDRYTQHPLLRAYACALLEQHGETAATFARYADHIITLAEQFDTLPLEQWTTLEPDFPHVDWVGDTLMKDAPTSDRMGAFAWTINRYVNHRRLAIQRDGQTTLRGLNWLEAGLAVYQAHGNQAHEADTLNNIGLAWSALGENRKALDYYEQALLLSRAVGHQGDKATILNNIGCIWSVLGEKRKALGYYLEALSLYKDVDDSVGEASTLDNIGQVWSTLGEKRKALDYYEQALHLQKAIGNRMGEATTLNNIGLAWSLLGENRKALGYYYEQALPLSRAVRDRTGEATTLNNIGLAWSLLGAKRKALDYYEQALHLSRVVGNRRGVAAILGGMGQAWSDLGDKHKALDFYEQALQIFCTVEDRVGEATTLSNIGGVWSALGENRKALDFYEQALPLSRAVGDRAGEATTLNNIGLAWFGLGENRKALDFYEQALPLSRAVGDRVGEATTLNNIGGVWSGLGENRKALDYFEQALPLSRAVGDRAGEATTCFNIGVAYYQLNDLDRAIEYIERCVELDQELKHPDLESDLRTLNKLKAERDGGGRPANDVIEAIGDVELATSETGLSGA